MARGGIFVDSIYTIKCILKLMRGDCRAATKKNERANLTRGSDLEGKEPIILQKAWRRTALPSLPDLSGIVPLELRGNSASCRGHSPCESMFGSTLDSCYHAAMQRTFICVAFFFF